MRYYRASKTIDQHTFRLYDAAKLLKEKAKYLGNRAYNAILNDIASLRAAKDDIGTSIEHILEKIDDLYHRRGKNQRKLAAVVQTRHGGQIIHIGGAYETPQGNGSDNYGLPNLVHAMGGYQLDPSKYNKKRKKHKDKKKKKASKSKHPWKSKRKKGKN